MNVQHMKWDDLQLVLAVTQAGSLSGAARALRLSHATVFRRLAALEQRLSVTLFERHRHGYTPTLAGEELAASAERVREEIHRAERRLTGQDLKLSGSLRVTTTDTLFAGLLSPIFADFRRAFPEIRLEVAISNQRHSLSHREADIALRPTHAPPPTLVGRQLGTLALAVYGQRQRWEPVSSDRLAAARWIGPDAHMGDTALEKWMTDKHVVYRLDSLLAIQHALRLGNEVAVLPCYLGDADHTLLRLGEPVAALATPLWLLTHPDLRHLARVRAFMEAVTDGVRQRLAQPE